MRQVDQVNPVAQRVLLKLDPNTSRPSKLLETPDISKALIQVGTVVRMGLGRIGRTGKRVPMEIAVGDRVVIKRYAGVEIRLDGEDFLMCMYDDIESLAVAA